MSLDKYVEGDILSTCNALGSEINGVYEKGKYSVECLKDILRYLKKDNEDHTILRFLGSIRLLQTDLLPIIKHYDKDKEIFDFTLRILVAITNPALLLYKEDVPDDKLSRNVYLQVISYLQDYKKALIDSNVWKILYEHLKDLLKIRPIERSNNENLFIERIIILIRNVLHVPSDESVHKQTDDDLSAHDKILQCLYESKLSILILYMSANEEEHKYCLHVLEIVSLMFREHTAETLANTNETRSNADKEKDLNLLLAARKWEQNVKLQKIKSLSSVRFNGVYCVKNMKSISDNDYISHRFIKSTNDVSFDYQKNSRRMPKNRLPARDVDNTRQSTLSVRLLLKKFCIEFLKTYNKLLMSVKRELLRAVSNEHDDTYYLWAICYFMQFNRLSDFEPALVSETISVQSFHHIQTQITNYQEMMMTDKKKTMFWSRRMQLGVSAYKELLETLKMMERSQDEVVRESADALISHVFYVIEYREMLLSLLSNYDEVKFPLSYLAKLVESTQLFLKMLENHSKKHSEIIVQKKQRKVRRKKKKKSVAPPEPVNTEDLLNKQWDAVSEELSASVQGLRPIPDVTPFDGASQMTLEEQKVDAIYQIREALIAKMPFDAVGLLRAARELWPDGDSFGAADIEPEPEFLVLREIHFSNLQRDPTENTNFKDEGIDSEEDEEEEAMASVAEQQLDLNDVYKKYANHKVVQPCSMLLANYQNNKPQTNTCLIKLLHRIAFSCKMHALFFQSSIFLTFQKIFHDPDVNYNPIIKEFYRFARFIIQKFVAVAEKNNKIFVELLFWKGPREAYELEEGYETLENSNNKGWTEDDEEELKYLYEENKDIYIEGQDVADIILANLNSRKRTKQQVISALKRLDLIQSAKDLRPEKRKEWSEMEIVELQHFFDDYRDSDDVMSIILDKLSIKRSKKAVTDKLLELNLISDRKEVHKKKGKRNKKMNNSFSDGNSSGDSEASDDDYNQEMHDEIRISNAESSGDEDEVNFFKNLEAERHADDNDSVREREGFQSETRISHGLSTNKNSKKLSEVWDKQEIMELTALFHENRESDNIMQILLDSLSVKRPKQAIIETLLELKLIKDKKEVRKKKTTSKTFKQSNLFKMSEKQKADNTDDEDPENDLENSISDERSKKLKEKKKLKRQIVSDSSDEDISLSSVSRSTNKSESSGKSQKSKSKNEPKIWEEEEIIELNRLFLDYKESDDIVANILTSLTIKRTKKNIIEKMLEIGLIKDKKEVQKKNPSKAGPSKSKSNTSEKTKRKKPSEVWDEQEVFELNQLYQCYKDSDNIMTDILQGLTVKRNKQNVVDKMLELRLIQDKKEIRKKRATKKLKEKHDSFETVDSDVEFPGNKSKNHKKNALKKISSESSDDENLPLSNVVPFGSKNNTDNSSNIFSINSDSEDTAEVRISPSLLRDKNSNFHELSSEESHHKESEDSGVVISSNESSFKNSKRKRRLVISDDSSDDDACKTVIDDFEVQSLSVLDPQESFQEESVIKRQKKKIRILDDSDDSS